MMIVDEVQTGQHLHSLLCRGHSDNLAKTGFGATGKFWAHEHWELATPPDIVTFSKKAQSAGFYFQNPDIVPDRPYRHFNT
jgi:4-aminobutyrate aminotransferase-like enzyme